MTNPAKLVLLGAVAIVVFVTERSTALQCYHCGMYNDGVGSITPCINETYSKLKACPQRVTNYCIKYTSEGTVVRDCVEKCVEKEDWGSRTFCCAEDACNKSPHQLHPPGVLLLAITCVFLLVQEFRGH